MAKYTAEYSCGHTGEVQLYGPEKDRQRKLEWYSKSGSCPACYKAELDAKRAAEAESAAKNAVQAGLPSIVDGSEKQIAWAERIRAEALAAGTNDAAKSLRGCATSLAFLVSKKTGHGVTQDNAAPRMQIILSAGKAARAALEAKVSARWWIDQRDTVNRYVELEMEKVMRTEFSDLFSKL